MRLTDPLDGLPGWWTPTPPQRAATHPPGGYSDHGLAHGITGVLALLSLTLREGLAVPGHREAIEAICACRLARHLAAGPQRASLVA